MKTTEEIESIFYDNIIQDLREYLDNDKNGQLETSIELLSKTFLDVMEIVGKMQVKKSANSAELHQIARAKFYEIACSLDALGLTKEANQLDCFAKGFWCDKHKEMKSECGCGKDKKVKKEAKGFWCDEHKAPKNNCECKEDDFVKASLEMKAKGFWCDKHKEMKSECGCGKDKKKVEKKADASSSRSVTVFNSCIRDVEEWLLIMKPKANLVSCNPDKLKTYWEAISKALNKFEEFCDLDMH